MFLILSFVHNSKTKIFIFLIKMCEYLQLFFTLQWLFIILKKMLAFSNFVQEFEKCCSGVNPCFIIRERFVLSFFRSGWHLFCSFSEILDIFLKFQTTFYFEIQNFFETTQAKKSWNFWNYLKIRYFSPYRKT